MTQQELRIEGQSSRHSSEREEANDTLKIHDAEMATLGAILVGDAGTFYAVRDVIKDGQVFASEVHREIWDALAEMIGNGQPVDMNLLQQQLDKPQFMHAFRCASIEATSANAEHYARIVWEAATFRALRSTGAQIATLQPGVMSAHEACEVAQSLLYDLAKQNTRGRLSRASTIADGVYRSLEAGAPARGVSTGFESLDAKTTGLHPADYVVLGGRPSMGKTAFALQVATHIAESVGPVLFISLEQTRESLVRRQISGLGAVDGTSLRTGELADGDWAGVRAAMVRLEQVDLWIDDDEACTPLDILTKARVLEARRGKLAAVFVDYAQLLDPPPTSRRHAGRTEDVTMISKGLKSVGKSLGVPMVVLSQLNRSLEQRPDKRPTLADLRESGSIEQDADLVLFLYRDEYYHRDTKTPGEAELIIGKQRNGPLGSIRLGWTPHLTAFNQI